jgi:hypothetical protein
MAADTVPNGTHFVVRFEEELSAGKGKVYKKFEAKTLQPLEISHGYILSPGAKIRIRPGGSSRSGSPVISDSISEIGKNSEFIVISAWQRRALLVDSK